MFSFRVQFKDKIFRKKSRNFYSLRKHKLPIYLQLPHTAVAFSENLFFGQISK